MSVCAYMKKIGFFFFQFDHLEFIEKAKNGMFYNGRAAKIHEVNLIQNLCS